MESSRALRITILFLVFAVVYGGSRQIRISTDAHLNHLQTRALALHADVDLDRYGKQKGFLTRRGDDVYSIYGVGVSLPALPFYVVLTRLGANDPVLHAFGSIPFAAAAVVLMMFLLGRLFDRRIAIGGALAFAFGTTLWTIGTTAFWQHALVAMFSVAGLYAFFSEDRRAPVWAGFALGWSVFIRPPTAILFVAIGMFYLVRAGRLRSVTLYLVGALPLVAGILIANLWLWGTWLQGGYATVGIGFHGDVLHNVGRLLFGWWRGLLVYSPVLGLAFVGGTLAVRRRRDPAGARMLTLFISSLITILFYARWTTWWGGGNQFGYRYLLDVVPALVLLGAYAAANLRWARAAAAVLAGASIATMAAGSVPDKFWWDQSTKVFARSAGASPLGRAWRAAIESPGPWLGRLAAIVVAGAVSAYFLRGPRPERPAG